VREWIADDNVPIYNPVSSYVGDLIHVNDIFNFGPTNTYVSPYYGNLGYADLASPGAGIAATRGGAVMSGAPEDKQGVFTVKARESETSTSNNLGFRCSYDLISGTLGMRSVDPDTWVSSNEIQFHHLSGSREISISADNGNSDLEINVNNSVWTDTLTQTVSPGDRVKIKAKAKSSGTRTVTLRVGGADSQQTMTLTVNTAVPGSECDPGYVLVRGNTDAGYYYNDFCVAQFEMKNDGSGPAVSQADGVPWTLSYDSAEQKCGEIGEGHDLISNAQWQTIARAIELEPRNWSGGVVGSGSLNVGVYDEWSPKAAHQESDPSQLNACYFNSGEGCSLNDANELKRTHWLSAMDDYIWDFSGNVREWVQFSEPLEGDSYSYIANLTGGYRSYFGSPDGNIYLDEVFGYAHIRVTDPYVTRGGGTGGGGSDLGVGIYRVQTVSSDKVSGFRCVHPPR
jgi:hypothetical protein